MKNKGPNMFGVKPAQWVSKILRVLAVDPIFKAGNVFLLQKATWVEPFVAQALNWATQCNEFIQLIATFGRCSQSLNPGD